VCHIICIGHHYPCPPSNYKACQSTVTHHHHLKLAAAYHHVLMIFSVIPTSDQRPIGCSALPCCSGTRKSIHSDGGSAATSATPVTDDDDNDDDGVDEDDDDGKGGCGRRLAARFAIIIRRLCINVGAVRSTTPTFALSLSGALDRPSPPTWQPSQPARRERLTLNMVFLQPSSFSIQSPVCLHFFPFSSSSSSSRCLWTEMTRHVLLNVISPCLGPSIKHFLFSRPFLKNSLAAHKKRCVKSARDFCSFC
jgi:hypothetical protein